MFPLNDMLDKQKGIPNIMTFSPFEETAQTRNKPQPSVLEPGRPLPFVPFRL